MRKKRCDALRNMASMKFSDFQNLLFGLLFVLAGRLVPKFFINFIFVAVAILLAAGFRS